MLSALSRLFRPRYHAAGEVAVAPRGAGGQARPADVPRVAVDVPPGPSPESVAVGSRAATETAAGLLDDPSGFATAARVWVAELRLEHGRGPDGDDVRRLLDALVADPVDGIRQLPAAAQATLAACNDPYVSISALADRCGRDPTVAQELLRHANSAFYGRGGAATPHLRAAVERVGVAGVRSVLLGVAVRGLLSRPGAELGGMGTAVWSHLVRTAPLARAVAPVFGAAPETCYALGLLHDVGKLVIVDRATDLRMTSRRTLRLPAAFVRDAFARLHEPVGALAALRWGLGRDAARAIGTHHRDAAMTPGHDPLSEALCLAERADLAAVRGEALDLPALWAAAALGGSPEAAAAALRQAAAPAA
jgi:HD-like signal output (HDOD) protein